MSDVTDYLAASGAHALALQAIARAMQPNPPLWVDRWCDAHMMIPADTGAAEPGRYNLDRTPWAREILQALSPEHPCTEVVVMAASQMVKTQTGLTAICAWADAAPGNMAIYEPTGDLTKRVSARLDKTIAAIPRLAMKFAAPRSRDARNTVGFKDFRGGSLLLATTGTPSSTAEHPCRYVYVDELDRSSKAVAKIEGSHIVRIRARTGTYGARSKIYWTSSPVDEETSEIFDLYKQGDQRRYHVPCPHCGHAHTLEWERLQFDGVVATMACPACGGVIEERHKPEMLAAGRWIATAEATRPGMVSFQLSYLYAPFGWTSWTTLAHEHADALKAKEAGDDEPLQAFWNTRLGAPWTAAKGTSSAAALKVRIEREQLPEQVVPAGALIVTASVDTQADRLEFKAVAWGEGMESWVIDKRVLHGSPSETKVWEELDDLHRTVRYARADGHEAHAIACMFVDSGGHHTQEVYNFTRHREHRHIYAIKGSSRPGSAIIPKSPTRVDINWRGRQEKHGAKLWFIGTDSAKDWIFSRIDREHGPGALHFNCRMTDDDLEQICAEYRVATYRRGHKVIQWHKKRSQRNEGLDLLVYNVAAAHWLGLHKLTAEQWAKRREKVCPVAVQGDLLAAQAPDVAPPQISKQKPSPRRHAAPPQPRARVW